MRNRAVSWNVSAAYATFGGPVQRSMARVQSIERAFLVLGALADGPVGVSEVAARVELPKSTVARLLASLTAEGAVERVTGDRRYRLGGRLLSLAASIQPTRSLIGLARTHLVELASELGEAAGLSIADGFDVHYIDQIETGHQVRIRDWTGSRVPMHAVSSGLVLLAHFPPSTLDVFLAHPLQRFTPRTTTDPSTLRARLRRVRADGYAWVHEEFAEGLNSVAAPVADESGAIVAAIHVHGPAYRFPREADERAIGHRVLATAGAISRRMRQDGRRDGADDR
jgi:DNA-binding IclR family transcriptional regulator